MKKLRKNARVGEVSGIASSIILTYDNAQKVKDDEFLKKIFSELKTLSEQITTAIEQAKVQSKLAEYDAKRNEKVSAMNAVLKGYAVLPVPEIAVSAKRLLKIFNRYGVAINSYGYLEQSSMINSLLNDFETSGEAQTDIAAVPSFEKVVEELSNAQKDFENIYAEYKYEQSKENLEQIPATKLSRDILALINEKITGYLDTMAMVDNAKYDDLAKTVEQMIIDINTKIATRTTKKKNSKMESVQPSVEGEEVVM